MNRDDVIDVLTVVAAATRRTVGEADVKIWQEIIGSDDKQLALRAVRDHLRDRPGVWLEPGHIHQGVRAIRRDEIAREPDEDRWEREAAIDAKVARQVAAIAGTEPKSVEPLKYRRPTHSALSIRCPWCKAGVGHRCVIPRTDQQLKDYHPSRREAFGEVGHA